MWEVEVDDAWEPEPLPPPVWSDSMAASSIRRAGYAESDVNIFPGTTPGAYEKVLFIFLDEPSIKAEDVYNYVRYRIREHIQGNPTEELRLVTNNEETLFDFFGWNVNRRVNALIKQWREVEPSFAPIISFEDYAGYSI
jgi:hypothetical protein